MAELEQFERDSLETLRSGIDFLDRTIIEALAMRNELVDQVGEIKREEGMDPYDPQRQRQMLDVRRLWALELGADPDVVSGVFEIIHDYSVERQRAMDTAVETEAVPVVE